MKRIYFTLTIVIFAAIIALPQSRTNRIWRPCPNSTAKASFEISRAGAITASPCTGQTANIGGGVLSSTTSLFSPYTTSCVYCFGNGDTVQDNLNGLSISTASASAVQFNNKFASTVGGGILVGFANFFQAHGTATGSTIYGFFNSASNRQTDAGNASRLIGLFSSAAAETTATTEVVGGDFSAIKGNLNGTPLVVGIRAVVGGYPTANEYIGGDFYVQTSISANNSPLAQAVKIRENILSPSTVTAYRGLSLSGWAGTGTITNSYGIYADATIDRGATRYFIYSLSTSPSFFTGKLTFDATDTAGGTTGSQTINKPSFSVNFAAGTSSLVVTNSFIMATSYVLCTVQTNDATALLKNATPAAGSVTIRLNANATAETRVACLVTN